MGFITDKICAEGLESLHIPSIPRSVEFEAEMFKQLTRNLLNLTVGDKNDNSDQACKEKSEMLF